MNPSVEEAYFSRKNYTGESHFHDCHQLIFITGGSAEVTVNKKSYTAKPGSIIILSRMEDHSIRPVDFPYERYILRINPLSPIGEGREYSLLLNRPESFVHLLDVSDISDSVKECFEEIIRERTDEGILTEKMQRLLLSRLLIMLYRRHSSRFSPLAGEEFELVFRIQQQFENDCAKNYSLSGLAKEYHVSTSTISHKFKKITGVSVFDYLYSCRLSSAKYFLAGTRLTVGEITEKCGFSDVSNFCRSFKRETGITPLEFRKAAESE